MTAIELFLNQPWVARVGWTLVHFLWQGALLAVLLAAARGLAGRRLTPRARHALACCTLGAMALALLVSFLALGRPDSGAVPAPVWLVSGAGWERALPWLVVVWFGGATGFSVRLIAGWRLTTRLRTVGVRAAPNQWEQALDELIRPGPGTAWAVGLLWLAGVGAVAMHGAVNVPALPSPARSDGPVSRLAVPTATPRIAPAVRAVPVRKTAPAAVAALLFDPLFAQPRAQAQNASASSQDRKKIHVSGTVLSLTGGPVKKATVRLLLADPPLDQRPTSYSEATDDGGKFTIEDVQPGNYTLQATKTGFLTARYGARTPSAPGAIISVAEDADVERLEIKLTPQGVVSGRITNADGEPVPHAWVYLLHTIYLNGKKGVAHTWTTADSLGIYTFNNVSPGRYFLGAQPMENPPGLERGMTDLMSYYPSVPYAEGAPVFDVTPGARVDGINVRLLRGKTYFVRGIVTFNGAPVKGSFSIAVTNPPPAFGDSSWSCLVRDGLFTMHDQSPGPHLMEVLSAGSEMPMRGLVGKMVFDIADSDVEVVFPLQQGVEASGVLRAEGNDWQSQVSAGTGSSGSPAPIPRPTIVLTAIDSRNARSYGQADDAGAFRLSPAIPGDYLLNVTGLPKDSYVKSVRFASAGATQAPLHLESGSPNLEIDISRKGAAINGALRGDKGGPFSGYVVLAWPKTPNLWSATHGVQSTSSDQRGTFKITGLAPGAYYVAAFEEIESGLRQYPDFLAKFENRAESVDLSEGSQADVNVKPIPKEAAEAEVAKLP